MNAQPQDHASMPFWDFMRSLDPEQAPGHGVDFNAAPNGGFPGAFPGAFPGDLPFRGPGPHARGHHGHHGPHGAGFEWGPWGPAGPWGGRRGGHGGGRGGGRFRRRGMNPGESEDDGFVSASDVENDAEKETQKEKEGSPNTMRDVDDEVPDPEEVTLTPDEEERPRRRCGGRGRFGGRGGPGGRGGRGGPGGRGRGGPHGGRFGPRGHGHGHFHGHGHGFGFGPFPGPHGPPPPPGPGGPFDFGGFMRGWAGHPFFRNLREQFQNAQPTDDDSFAPPVDIFNTESAFILHVALPGAKKEDIGVNWDADSSILNIAGVIYRPGDEEFLSTLTSAERKVGMFERNVTLPPQGAERDEVDGLSISAKMVDGILIVTVPKIEKEWTEIHKVDIQ